MNLKVLIIILIFINIKTLLCKQQLKKRSSSSSTTTITLSSGLTLNLVGKSSQLLHQWAIEIDRYGGVTHNQAASREQQIIAMMQQGSADINTYYSYQRLVAGTGNVDSARLLMDYGVGLSLSEQVSPVFRAVILCDINTVKSMIHDGHINVDHSTDDGMAILIVASFSGCLDLVDFLISEGCDVEAYGSNGVNALMAAASKGYTKIIESLVTKGHANLNSKHKFAMSTAMHMAAELGQTNSIKKLCDLGANVAARTSLDSTPLHIAANVGIEDQGKEGTLDALVEYCKFDVDSLMNNDTTATFLSSQNGFVKTTEKLLMLGANVNFSMPIAKYVGDNEIVLGTGWIESVSINSLPSNGAGLIHAAAEEGHSLVVQTLIDFGADINSKTIGVTPIILATQHNRSSVISILIKNGALLDETSLLDGSSALYCAVGKGYNIIVEQLLIAGADPQIQPRLPIVYAALSGQYESVKILIKYNVDVNMVSNNGGITGLLAAASKGDVAIIKLLLNHGADPRAITNDGFNIFHLITLSKNSFKTEIMRKLCNFREELVTLLNSLDKEGNSILHYAVSKQDMILTQFLIDKEVNINIKNNNDEFPLFTACSLGNLQIVTMLLSVGVSNIGDEVREATSILVAIEKNYADIVLALLKSQEVSIDGSLIETNIADVNKGTSGIRQSPLLFAVILGRSSIANILLQQGAHCNIIIATSNRNDINDGETLLELAQRKRDFDMIQVLSNYSQCDSEVIRTLH